MYRADKEGKNKKKAREIAMNILIVTSSMDTGGAETHVFELARELVRIGHKVCLASAGGRLIFGLEAEGVSHTCLPLDKKDPISTARNVRGIAELIRRNAPRVVHAHTRISAYASSIACGEAVPLVCTVHCRFGTSPLLCRLSKWGERTVAVSLDLREHLLLSCPRVAAENVTVIPNGIDTERFVPLKKDSAMRRVTFMSRLDGDCSHTAFALCRIAQRLCERLGELEIVIAGGGSEREKLFEMAECVNRQVGQRVVYVMGHADNTPELLGRSHAFVGVSRAALEAMSCGVPVILSGDEGFFGVVSPDNAELCAQTNFCGRGEERVTEERLYCELVRLLEMRESERERLGLSLREYVARHHSAQRMVALTVAVYEGVSNSRRYSKKSKGGTLLCGYYGYGNLGDECLLRECIRRGEREYPNEPVRALTKRGRADRDRYGVPCIRRKDMIGVTAAVLSSDRLVLGGGTLLQNSTSHRSLWYYLYLIALAHMTGRAVELWGNGIGKIEGRIQRRLSAEALSRCRTVELRDTASVLRLGELIRESPCDPPSVRLVKDLASSPVYKRTWQTEAVLSRLGVGDGERLVAVALRGEEDGESMDACVRWLMALRRSGIRLIFLVLYPERDMSITRRICCQLEGILAYPLSVSEMQELMRRCLAVCSMRYHALVFSSIVGVPFIGFGKQEKIIDLCRSDGGKYYTEAEQSLFCREKEKREFYEQ